MGVKLHNKGKRLIIVEGEFKFLPSAVVEFPEAIAEKLLKLFADEVEDLEKAAKVFEVAQAFEVKEEAEEQKARRGRPPKAQQ